MKTYLQNLVIEKGKSLDTDVLQGHIGLDYNMLIDYIDAATEHHEAIRAMLVKIDFHNGDVFHYLEHLANGMVKALGMDIFA